MTCSTICLYLLVACLWFDACVHQALAGGTPTSYNSYGSYGTTSSGLDQFGFRGYGYNDGIRGTGRDVYSQRDFRDYSLNRNRYPYYGSGPIYGRLPYMGGDGRRYDDYDYRYNYVTPINNGPGRNYYGSSGGGGGYYRNPSRLGYDVFPVDLWKK